MKMMLNVDIPHEPFNSLVRAGTAGDTLSKILDSLKPQAVYFTEQHGRRGAVLLIEVESPSDVPRFAEPPEPRRPRQGGSRKARQAVGVAAGSPKA